MAGIVAVIDDDVSVRDSLGALLSINGFTVHLYETGDRFLANIPATQRLCLVVDFFMPDLTGLDIITYVRERNLRFPIILVSGTEANNLASKAFAAGATRFMLKPYRPNHMIQEIVNVLDDHHTPLH